MPADRHEVYTAAEILGHIEELVTVQNSGLVDVSESIEAAIASLNETPCQNLSDTLAFIGLSRHLAQTVFQQLAQGTMPDDDIVQACDRYMETAIAYIQAEEARIRHGHFGGHTLH